MPRSIAALVAFAAALAAPLSSYAQSTLSPAPATLRAAFDAAWSRQPEAASHEARRAATDARKRVAENWTAEPPAFEAGVRSDRLGSNNGAVEFQAGLALPLWLPGERDRSAALAEAEGTAVESRIQAARLRIAGEVRDAYWAFQRAAMESELATVRLDSARALAADVARRVAAGDLARADSHQAEAAVAAAEVAVAEARGTASEAAQRLRALSGVLPGVSAHAEPPPAAAEPPRHPGLQELEDRLEAARRGRELAAVQTRANPEVTIGTVRERSGFGSPTESSLAIGIRLPFGSEARSEGRAAVARAEVLEAESQLRLERDRVAASVEAARARLDASRMQLDAAQRRARLARESRGFFERSFRLGESDLPTRLRIELEAHEADRQAARHAIEAAAAVSALRQALGLLPQ